MPPLAAGTGITGLLDHQQTFIPFAGMGYALQVVLPLLVDILAENPGHPRSVLQVQHPELGLHPEGQAALGDIFIQALGRTNSVFLIESHAELLVLRLARRIRNRAEELSYPLHPAYVSLVQVYPALARSKTRTARGFIIQPSRTPAI